MNVEDVDLNESICHISRFNKSVAPPALPTLLYLPATLVTVHRTSCNAASQAAMCEASLFLLVILPVLLYGCETWSLTLREERRLRVFENRVLWRVFGPKRDEVTGEWRKYLYSLPNIVRVVKSRRMRWAGYVARMGW
jgi:hypothetical protein